MTIEEYFGDWSKVINLKEANKIVNRLTTYNNVCPQIKDIFKAFRYCTLSNLRVLILGQDPYPDLYKGKPRATGIAFGNAPNTPLKDYSPSLDVIRNSVIDFSTYKTEVNFDCSLEKWEEQGVLMLNSALSCEVGKPQAHALLWRPFMKSLLSKLSEWTTGIVYVLMGSAAQSYEDYINSKFNHILKTRHPAYYSRIHEDMPSEVWTEVNNILIGQNGYGIKWFNIIN